MEESNKDALTGSSDTNIELSEEEKEVIRLYRELSKQEKTTVQRLCAA